MESDPTPHYRRPGWFTRNVMNRSVAGLARLGVSLKGSQVLEVRGRRTGEAQQVPVNLLRWQDRSYLVSARGEGEWVRNVRAAGGELTLVLGRKRTPMRAIELVADDTKVPVLREYLERWGWEVGAFFDGVGAKSSDAELAAISSRHPVFELVAPE